MSHRAHTMENFSLSLSLSLTQRVVTLRVHIRRYKSLVRNLEKIASWIQMHRQTSEAPPGSRGCRNAETETAKGARGSLPRYHAIRKNTSTVQALRIMMLSKVGQPDRSAGSPSSSVHSTTPGLSAELL